MSQASTATSRLLAAVRVVPVTMLLAGAIFGATAVGAADLDTDQDGLFDQDEISVYFTNPNNADSDGDGSSDGDEVYYGTDPLVANAAPVLIDSDGDGLYDADERSYYGTEPAIADTDGDGVSDGAEVYAGTDPRAGALAAPAPDGREALTPDLIDTDGDGLSDGDEAQRGTNPTSFDSDRDGLRDGEEVLTYGTNPLAWDSNGNGISDWEDIAARTTGAATNAPAPATTNEPTVNEPVEPMAPPVSAADQEKILDGNGTTACEIEGACGNGVSPDPHCFETELQDGTRLSADC